MLKRIRTVRAWMLASALVVLLNQAAYCQTPTVQTASPLSARDSARMETAIGDLFADAVRSAVKADIAFVAASELRVKDAPIPAGEVAVTDITAFASYPDDPLAEVRLTGKAVKQALEKSVSIYPQPSLGFLQVSGLRFTIDPARKPGERVTDVRVGASPLNETSTYKVAMSNSLANGALGYWKIWSKDDISRKLDGVTMVGAVSSFLKENPSIDYGKLDRIRVVR